MVCEASERLEVPNKLNKACVSLLIAVIVS